MNSTIYLPCFVFVGNNKIKSLKDGNTIYLSSRELCLNSKLQVEWFSVFIDVSLYADYLRNIIALPQVVCSNIVFSKKNIPPVFAHNIFHSQTRVEERNEFDYEKSSVLGADIPARSVKGRGWSHVAHKKCTSDICKVSCSAYSYSYLYPAFVFVSVSSTKHTLNAI